MSLFHIPLWRAEVVRWRFIGRWIFVDIEIGEDILVVKMVLPFGGRIYFKSGHFPTNGKNIRERPMPWQACSVFFRLTCLRGAFPPVLFLAVCLVLAIFNDSFVWRWEYD